MARALVAIGVNKTDGSFPDLKGAVKDAKAFCKWGQGQGFDCTLLTDERKKVRLADVYEAIKKFVSAGTYSQIVVYFSGHGILQAPDCEFWLLSGAPENENEAINVLGSISKARSSGIEHVVFISDACRSLPSDLKNASIGAGGTVFPFGAFRTPLPEVDVFYATLPGDVSLELPPDSVNARDRGLMTQCLLRALSGDVPQVINQADIDGVAASVVSSRPLKAWLTAEVPLAATAIALKLQQVPDIRIESDSPKYLSNLSLESPPGKLRPSSANVLYGPAAPTSLVEHSLGARRLFAPRNQSQLASQNGSPLDFAVTPKDENAIDLILRSVGADSVVGTGLIAPTGLIRTATSNFGELKVVDDGLHSRVIIPPQAGKHPSNGFEAAIRFNDGRGMILAFLPGNIGTIVMDEGHVATVNFTPAIGALNYEAYLHDAAKLERHRATLAVAARKGALSLSDGRADEFGRYLAGLKLLDPTTAMYACYAYARAGRFDQIIALHRRMEHQPSWIPFDVELLATQFADGAFPVSLPGIPMLTEGWLMFGNHQNNLPELLQRAHRFLQPSLWATFSENGMTILEQYAREKKVVMA